MRRIAFIALMMLPLVGCGEPSDPAQPIEVDRLPVGQVPDLVGRDYKHTSCALYGARLKYQSPGQGKGVRPSIDSCNPLSGTSSDSHVTLQQFPAPGTRLDPGDSVIVADDCTAKIDERTGKPKSPPPDPPCID